MAFIFLILKCYSRGIADAVIRDGHDKDKIAAHVFVLILMLVIVEIKTTRI